MEGRGNVWMAWGISIGLHVSWLFVFGLVTWSLAGGYFGWFLRRTTIWHLCPSDPGGRSG